MPFVDKLAFVNAYYRLYYMWGTVFRYDYKYFCFFIRLAVKNMSLELEGGLTILLILTSSFGWLLIGLIKELLPGLLTWLLILLLETG